MKHGGAARRNAGRVSAIVMAAASVVAFSGSPAPADSSPVSTPATCTVPTAEPVFPGTSWATATPESQYLDPEKLAALASAIGGSGFVVRNGYSVYGWGNTTANGDISSGAKPIISTYLLKAIQDGIIASPDSKVAAVNTALGEVDAGRYASMTWRHLASMTSGYGLAEAPGAAFGYNDYAIHLYLLSLQQAFGYSDINDLIRTTLTTPLGLEDNPAHATSGNRRLSMSVRDWARVGWMYLNKGRWGETQVIKPALAEMAVSSPVWTDVPRTSGVAAPMIPGAATFGGTFNQTGVYAGHYSFNWWLNSDWRGDELVPALPADTYSADGHWGRRKLWVIPSENLVVAWNGASSVSADAETQVPSAAMATATQLMSEMVLDTPPATCDPGTIEVPVPGPEVEVPGPERVVTVTEPGQTRTVEVPGPVAAVDRTAPHVTVKATLGAKGKAARTISARVTVNEPSLIEAEVRASLKRSPRRTVILADATSKRQAAGTAWTRKLTIDKRDAQLVKGGYALRVAVTDTAGNRTVKTVKVPATGAKKRGKKS